MEKQNRIFSGFDADAIDRTTAADLAEVGSDKWTLVNAKTIGKITVAIPALLAKLVVTIAKVKIIATKTISE